MEIHELNTFSGTPGAGDFLATDNGTDTSKIAIKTITDPLNTRIDNIIAGPASSAQEVIDARLGASVLGGVTYNTLGAAIREQTTQLYNDTADLESRIGESLSYSRSYFTSGKLITRGNVGDVWATSDNASSIYTATAIDVSQFRGEILEITKNYAPTSSSRYIGFVDASGKWVQTPIAESGLTLEAEGGLYKAKLPIVGDYFVASFSASNTVLGIYAFKAIVPREEIDDIEADIEDINQFVGLEENIPYAFDNQYTYYSNRITSESVNNPLELIKSISINAVSGFDTTLWFGTYPSGDAPYGWKSSAWEYVNDGRYSNFWVGARKSDNSNISDADLAAFEAGINIIITKKTVYDKLSGSGTVAYVATTGDDNNSGTTRATPFATIQKAIDSGASTILVKEGIYNQGFSLANKSGISIEIDHAYDSYTAVTDEDNPKVIIDGTNNSLQVGATIANCTNCHFSNIEIRNTTSKGFSIDRCDNVRFDDCVAHNIGIGQSGSIGGFLITYSNGDFYNCAAYNIGTITVGTGTYHYDGFNIHYTGTTNFVNCKAWNCEDDGISHHDACCGLIDGGEWYNCGKGGIASPTHGAKVNVQNAYSHDNKYGIYMGNDNAVTDRGNIIVSNCALKNNSMHDLYANSYYKVKVFNCIMDTYQGTNIEIIS